MNQNRLVRADKFLWAARIYKTRSMATDSCRKGRVIINGSEAKPSRLVSQDDLITVKKPPVIYTYRVLHPGGNRVSAGLVSTLIEDLTTEEEKSKLLYKKSLMNGFREKGSGRPTKKERRTLDKLNENINHH